MYVTPTFVITAVAYSTSLLHLVTVTTVEGGAEGLKQSTFCMAHRKTMFTMGSPYFVWINANEIIVHHGIYSVRGV